MTIAGTPRRGAIVHDRLLHLADQQRAFAARGVTHVVECGPGRVLTGLNKRIARELTSYALTDGADIDTAKGALAG